MDDSTRSRISYSLKYLLKYELDSWHQFFAEVEDVLMKEIYSLFK